MRLRLLHEDGWLGEVNFLLSHIVLGLSCFGSDYNQRFRWLRARQFCLVPG